jgi:hypothetical protein
MVFVFQIPNILKIETISTSPQLLYNWLMITWSYIIIIIFIIIIAAVCYLQNFISMENDCILKTKKLPCLSAILYSE